MCNATAEKTVVTHKWEDAGHGKAPFAFVDLIAMPSAEAFGMNISGYNGALRQAFDSARQYGINSLGSCDVCGTGIHNHCVISDANGKYFKVGCDCVMKTDDSKLMTATKNAERLRLKAIREAKRQAEWEASRLRTAALLEAERQANGGLTNSEVAEKNRKAELELTRQNFSAQNKWLIDVLNRRGGGGEFVTSMMDKLELSALEDFSDRCLSIMADIYSKVYGRRNSKGYQEAQDKFYSHLPQEESE